ncbi:hypothetical protein AKJ16_DCAP15584 [Drosera capensis]
MEIRGNPKISISHIKIRLAQILSTKYTLAVRLRSFYPSDLTRHYNDAVAAVKGSREVRSRAIGDGPPRWAAVIGGNGGRWGEAAAKGFRSGLCEVQSALMGEIDITVQI